MLAFFLHTDWHLTGWVLPYGLPEWAPWVAGVAAIVAAWLIIQAAQARKRTEALTAVAQEIGCYFQGQDWNGPQAAPQLATALFNRGRTRKSRNIMTGSAAGFRAALFDYSFTEGYGRSQRTYGQTVAAFSKNGAVLPQFSLQEKGIMQKIGNAFAHKDIQFDSNAEFSRSHQVRSPDKTGTRALFTPQLIAFLETLDGKKKWRLEGGNDTLILYRLRKKVKPEDFRSYLEETSGIATSFFSYSGARSIAG